ncbi:hypothetical protein SIO70_02895 [Chitinophaga sancti]|uniref:hypothetical protein n=1 Tax=Chitinophaga sancti TaxID=1004 RepID=UPI002A7561B9|nr:hypothetical protein [Chitinophaga sancti]WPQ63805.1 hypothetical protein SIO70_02895 [Chitinophaga sancti]
MQSVKITIEGDYIDCQIYRGRLYLWAFDGSLRVYKWNELVESLVADQANLLAMTYCFLESSYIYDYYLTKLFLDEDFKKLLIRKFETIGGEGFQLTEDQAANFLIKQQDTPGKLLPTDTEIYGNTLYYINETGLYSTGAHRYGKLSNPVSSRPSKLWDCRLLSIKANKYPQIALSAGEDGLFEFNKIDRAPITLPKADTLFPIYKISEGHSSFANYSFLSIYNTSLISQSYMALFTWNMNSKESSSKRATRDFQRTVPDNFIFRSGIETDHISWGIQDKIYRATDTGFEIVKFDNGNGEREPQWSQLDFINLRPWKGKVIGGSAAHFGTIVECENALVIMLSDGQVMTIAGPITRWRVYPRSNNYENQLHVILDDKIEIYSFNQDYFVNQENKEFGIEFIADLHKNRP